MPLGFQQQLTQRMALAAHMRHALALLQAPSMELGQLLRREAEQNPVLEVLPPRSETSLDAARAAWERSDRASGGARDDGAPPASFASAAEPGEPSPAAGGAGPDGAAGPEPADPASGGDFEVLGRLDDADYLYSNGGNNEYGPDAEEKRKFFLDSIPATESLQQHLADQLENCALSPEDRALAEETIGSLDDDGYLRTPLADIAQSRLRPVSDAERALRLVQGFDPAGVGARDLRECLLLQFLADPPRKPAARAALRILRDPAAFALVASNRRGEKIGERLGLLPSEVEEAIRVFALFDPRPGRKFSAERTVFVSVEIVVRKEGGRWVAALDDSSLPRLAFSPEWTARHEELRGRADKSLSPAEREARAEEKHWVDEKFRAAELLVQGLSQRQATLLSVASAIVDGQQEYFDKGKTALRPMSMAEIAKKAGIGESTVSRCVSGKWLRSPQGVVPLRDFFTNGVKTASGAPAASSESVRERIRLLVAAEDPSKPLSDQAIVAALKERGVEIARRTVAKYRDALRIPPAAARRR